MNPARQFFFSEMVKAIPERLLPIIPWAEKHVNLFGARGKKYVADTTPWTKEVIQDFDDPHCKFSTFVKPIQAGGSSVGEIVVCRAIVSMTGGDIQWNWEDDEKAKDRWDKREEKILKGCAPVNALVPSIGRERHKDQKCLIIFPTCNLTMQGTWTESALDSDSIAVQINEEIHNWKPGRLAMARGRQTAVWNSKAFDISNASNVNDQLHEAFLSGTQQWWEVKCPGCGLYHEMHMEWNDKRPDLGGLRYDSEGCKMDSGVFSYTKLAPTIRYQMPCGYEVRDTTNERRALSLSGRYGAPKNEGALISHRSRTLESVSIDYIPWVSLIEEKHIALRALKNGDPEPWRRYLTRRECKFWNPENRPLVGKIVVNTLAKKSREGLSKHPDFALRAATFDYQKGYASKGQSRHYWLVIRDFLKNGDSQLVYEGMIETDQNLVSTIAEHNLIPKLVIGDSGHEPDHIRQLCLNNGWNVLWTGQSKEFYKHKDGTTRVYSEPVPLHTQMPPGTQPKFSYRQSWNQTTKQIEWMPDPREPSYVLVHKYGLLRRLIWLRSEQCPIKFEAPSDVSEEYKKHNEAWELATKKKTNGEEVEEWRQHFGEDHTMLCEAYMGFFIDISGLLGGRIRSLGMQDLFGASTENPK